jgi:hypothetical protein
VGGFVPKLACPLPCLLLACPLPCLLLFRRARWVLVLDVSCTQEARTHQSLTNPLDLDRTCTQSSARSRYSTQWVAPALSATAADTTTKASVRRLQPPFAASTAAAFRCFKDRGSSGFSPVDDSHSANASPLPASEAPAPRHGGRGTPPDPTPGSLQRSPFACPLLILSKIRRVLFEGMKKSSLESAMHMDV